MNEQEVFFAVLECEGRAEREACLEAACLGDAALRRRIEKLLISHERCEEFLEVSVLEQLSANETVGPGAALRALATAPASPDGSVLALLRRSDRAASLGRLGRYEAEAIIGRGSCGVVLLAEDEKLTRHVAIKTMTPELASVETARLRFLREASAAARIQHENVARVFDVQEWPLPYFVMEYVGGETLQAYVDRVGPLDAEEVLRIGMQIAAGLAAAHEQGLVHRDVKPCNILLARDTGCVKLVDFGIARIADDASLTYPGMIAGTPRYMSPEQVQSRPIDARSDLFSLGSVLYFMRTGVPPFDASTSIAAMRSVVEDVPPALRIVAPGTPERLSAIVARSLEKDPSARFQTAERVREALADCLARLERGEIDATPAPAVRPATMLAGIAIVAFLAIFGLTESFGVTGLFATVLRIASPHGTLIVETDDPKIGVRIDGEEMILTGAGVDEIRLKPGAHEFVAAKDGKVLTRQLLSVEKDGEQALRVSAEARRNAEAAVVPQAVPETVEPPAEDALADNAGASRLAEALDDPGSWQGTRTYRRGAFAGITVPYFVHFRPRDGATLRGEKYDNGPMKNFATVTGKLDGAKVVWHEQAPRGDSFDAVGELFGDELRITFTGTYPGGSRTEGDGVLKLVRRPKP